MWQKSVKTKIYCAIFQMSELEGKKGGHGKRGKEKRELKIKEGSENKQREIKMETVLFIILLWEYFTKFDCTDNFIPKIFNYYTLIILTVNEIFLFNNQMNEIRFT